MKHYRIYLFFIIVALLIASLTGCAPKQEQINWTLHGTWVTEDGTLGESASFTFSGNLPFSFDGLNPEIIELDIPLPEIFGFDNSGLNPCGIMNFSYENDKVQEILRCTGGVHNPKTNRPCAMTFYILDRECIIFEFSDAPDEYLVATVDPDADVLQWLDIYKELLAS